MGNSPAESSLTDYHMGKETHLPVSLMNILGKNPKYNISQLNLSRYKNLTKLGLS